MKERTNELRERTKRIPPAELSRPCEPLACQCQRRWGSGPTPPPCWSGSGGDLLLARFRAGTAQTQFPFLHPVSAAALLIRGCPVPQPPTVSLSSIHLSPSSLPQTALDSPGPDLKPGERPEAASSPLLSSSPPPHPPIPDPTRNLRLLPGLRRQPPLVARPADCRKPGSRERGSARRGCWELTGGRGGDRGKVEERAEGRRAEEGLKWRGGEGY